MKRKGILSLSILFAIMISAIFGNFNFSYARVVTDDPSVQSGGSVSITVSTTTAVSSFKIQLVDAGGLTFQSASRNSSFDNGSSNGSTINGATTGQPSTKLATYTFKAPEVTETKKYTVTFSVTGMDNEADTTNTSTVTVNPKPTSGSTGGNTGGSTGGTSGGGTTGGNTGTNTGGSTGGTTGGGTTTTTPAKPTFKDVSKTVYATGDINLRSSWSTSSAAVQVEKGTELRLTGTSTEKVNGYVWYRVTYNGKIKYVSKDLITETKPEEEKSKNANLKSLTIEGVDLIPEFNPEVTEYSVKLIDFKDRDLNITAEPEDEKSVVKIVGNTNITDENEITITVTAEDGTSKIYTIKAIKETTKAFGLASLTIKDVELKGFSTEKYEYKVQFETLDKLEIEAIATEEGATIEILGNENLKEGENLITIMVTSVDGTKTATYQIKATKLVVVEQEEVKEINMKAVLISGIIALVVLVIIIILITVYVRRNSLPVVDYEYHDNLDNNNENDTEFADEIAPNTNSEKEVKTSRVDELFTQDIEEDRPRRRGKGKHSK